MFHALAVYNSEGLSDLKGLFQLVSIKLVIEVHICYGSDAQL